MPNDPDHQFSVTTTQHNALDSGPSGQGALTLQVIGSGLIASHPLPASGRVMIGRAPSATIRIPDSRISRQHLVLHVGDPLVVEALQSVNGTTVGGRLLRSGERVPVSPGDPIHLGPILIVIQRSGRPAGAPGSGAEVDPSVDTLTNPPVAGGAIERLHRLTDQIAPGDISVLILGETGAGKEVLAERVHQGSLRRDKPFVRLNCAALSETLLESELFGHEKGAFTGALQAKPGLLETAHGGSVFLDEIGEMSAATQAKLLRVLEQREVLRVGGLRARPIDVRFIAATHRPIQDDIVRGRFRQDLYFRLNGITLRVPPLRERVSEIPAFVELFLRQGCRKLGRAEVPVLSDEALRLLQRHHWPGNIRELRNVIERTLLTCQDRVIRAEEIALEEALTPVEASDPLPIPSAGDPVAEADPPPLPPSSGLRGQVQALEYQQIVEALARCGGNQTRAAKLLGISRGTLRARLDAYRLPRPRKGVP